MSRRSGGLRSGETTVRPIDLDAVIRAGIAIIPTQRSSTRKSQSGLWPTTSLPEVFTNLVSNSVNSGSRESRSGSVLRRDDGMVEVSVEDTGPGVPDPVKPLLFTRFVRGTNTRSGKGLGLYITRMLVERYGGSIRVEDRVPGHPECGPLSGSPSGGATSRLPPDPDRVRAASMTRSNAKASSQPAFSNICMKQTPTTDAPGWRRRPPAPLLS